METVLYLSLCILVLFGITKWVELKFIDKTQAKRPFKLVIRDAFFVFMSAGISIGGYFFLFPYLSDFFQMVTNKPAILHSASTPIFTDNPGF